MSSTKTNFNSSDLSFSRPKVRLMRSSYKKFSKKCWNSIIALTKNRNLLSFVLLFMMIRMEAQTVLNGNFNNGTNNWGCTPEVNVETVYGGSNSANNVAEIDALAGLCQTISGFAIGATYTLTFDCARRVGSPTFMSMDVIVDGSVLSANVSRNGTPFSMGQESFNFIATATTHTLTFNGTSAGTLGLLVDNISLSVLLPIELLAFDVVEVGGAIEINWSTISETNSDFFVVEHSENGQDWVRLNQIKGAGNSISRIDYHSIDATPFGGHNYYRLKLVDLDGKITYSKIKVVKCKGNNVPMIIYPNPTEDIVHYQYEASKIENLSIDILDVLGNQIRSEKVQSRIGINKIPVDLGILPKGSYVIQINNGANVHTAKVILK